MQAEDRLVMIEHIAKYQEEKMKREYDKLQEELENEAQRERMEALKESKRQKRMELQRKQLDEHHRQKELERFNTRTVEKELGRRIREQRMESLKTNDIIVSQTYLFSQIVILQKLKLKEYYESKQKAQEMLYDRPNEGSNHTEGGLTSALYTINDSRHYDRLQFDSLQSR